MRSGLRLCAVWLSVLGGTASVGCVGTTDSLGPEGDPPVQDESRTTQSTRPTYEDAGSTREGEDAASHADSAPDAAFADASSPDAPIEIDAGSSADARVACGCTRRPGAGTSKDCPAGGGESASLTMGPGGGTLPLQGQQGLTSGVVAELTLPGGAMATTTDVTLTETTIAPPENVLDGSPVYLAGPAGLTLTGRASLQLPYSGVDGSMGAVTLWFSPDGTCYVPVPDSSVGAGSVQGTITQLGYVLVGVVRTAATASCP